MFFFPPPPPCFLVWVIKKKNKFRDELPKNCPKAFFLSASFHRIEEIFFSEKRRRKAKVKGVGVVGWLVVFGGGGGLAKEKRSGAAEEEEGRAPSPFFFFWL